MSQVVKKNLLPMGLAVGESLPRKSATPLVCDGGVVGLDTLRAFANSEGQSAHEASATAANATTEQAREEAVTAVRGHCQRLLELNLLIRLQGGQPVVTPAIHLL